MTYREAGRSPLGEVRQRYIIARRPRYLGSANAVARASPLSPGGMILPSTGHAPSLPATRRTPTGAVEVCDHGVRVRTPDSVLELLWDQIVDVERVTDPSGLVGLIIRGSHGEEVHLDRRVRGLPDLGDTFLGRNLSR